MVRLKRLIREIHQRSLWQALVVYLGVSYAILEAIDLFIDRAGVPAWLFPVALTLLLIGLPIVIVASLTAEEEYGDEVPAESAVAAAEEDRRLRFLTWRSAGVALVGALALWGIMLTGWVLFGQREAGAEAEVGPLDPAHRIAVLPFSYRGDDEYAYLGDGMVELVSFTLDDVGGVGTVTPQAVFSVLRQHGDDVSEPERSAAVARRLHAGRYVEGEVIESGGHLRISARFRPVGGGPATGAAAVVDGKIEDGVGLLVDELGAQLLVGADAGQLVSQLGRVANSTTDSLAALKFFLDGLSSKRAWHMGQARAAFGRAVEIDSSFALAWWQLADSHIGGGGSPEFSIEAARRAVQLSDQLPWRERQNILGLDAWIRGDFHAAVRHYQALTRRYPEDVTAWNWLSMTYQYYGALHGREPAEGLESARQAYLRSREYDPEWFEPPFTYWWVAVQMGDSVLADSLLQRWTTREEQPFYTRVFEAFCVGDRVAQDSVVTAAGSLSQVRALFATHYVGLCQAGVPRGAEIARAFARRAAPGRVRAWSHVYAAMYELALGHRRAAQAEFEAARADDPTWALEYEPYWLLPDAFLTERGELEAARATLLGWEAPVVSPIPAPDPAILNWYTTVNDSIHPHIRLYLLGRLSARLGDYDSALRYADEVEKLNAPLFHASLPQDQAQSIRAHVLAAQGHYGDALAALEAAPRVVSNWTIVLTPFVDEPQERFLRAQLLAELGRYDEALRWLSTVGRAADQAPMLAPAHLLTAQIHERLGAADSAAVHYKRFIGLWRDCDPELRPQVEAAERALERLTSEGVTH